MGTTVNEQDGNSFLKLQDEEPYDYALVERVFPKGEKKTIEFQFRAPKLPQGTAAEIEVLDQRSNRALKLRIDKDWLSFDIDQVQKDPVKINPKKWNSVKLDIDCINGKYTVEPNGKEIEGEINLNGEIKSVERITFRTGPYRGYVPAEVADHGIGKQTGFYSEDLPGADFKAPLIEFDIDKIVTEQD